jgi:hypothetical protein
VRAPSAPSAPSAPRRLERTSLRALMSSTGLGIAVSGTSNAGTRVASRTTRASTRSPTPARRSRCVGRGRMVMASTLADAVGSGEPPIGAVSRLCDVVGSAGVTRRWEAEGGVPDQRVVTGEVWRSSERPYW